jgi:hypothetical protein
MNTNCPLHVGEDYIANHISLSKTLSKTPEQEKLTCQVDIRVRTGHLGIIGDLFTSAASECEVTVTMNSVEDGNNSMNRYALTLLASAFLTFFAPHRAEAGIILHATESGSSVVFTFSGSIDLTGAPGKGSLTSGSFINPGLPAVAFEGGASSFDKYNLPAKTWAPYGSVGI